MEKESVTHKKLLWTTSLFVYYILETKCRFNQIVLLLCWKCWLHFFYLSFIFYLFFILFSSFIFHLLSILFYQENQTIVNSPFIFVSPVRHSFQIHSCCLYSFCFFAPPVSLLPYFSILWFALVLIVPKISPISPNGQNLTQTCKFLGAHLNTYIMCILNTKP